MSGSLHTPGVWYVEHNPEGFYVVKSTKGEQPFLFVTYSDTEQDKANADQVATLMNADQALKSLIAEMEGTAR